MNSSTSRYAEKKQTQEEIKRQIALLQARLEPEPEPHTGPLVPKRKSIQSVTLATATPSPSQYDISQLYPMLTYLKPEKKRKLEHNATAQLHDCNLRCCRLQSLTSRTASAISEP